VGFGLLYKVIPLLSVSSQLLPILHLEHLYIFEDSIYPSILGSSCWPFPKWCTYLDLRKNYSIPFLRRPITLRQSRQRQTGRQDKSLIPASSEGCLVYNVKTSCTRLYLYSVAFCFSFEVKPVSTWNKQLVFMYRQVFENYFIIQYLTVFEKGTGENFIRIKPFKEQEVKLSCPELYTHNAQLVIR
jgi:hypothetical protein